MVGLRALAKSSKSGSGAHVSKLNDFSKGFNKKKIGLRALAKSWKSGSGAQASKLSDFSKGFNKNTARCEGSGQILEIWLWRPGDQTE